MPRSRRTALATALLATAVVVVAARQTERVSIRLTSPLGRSGLSGTLRIVAQVQAPPDAILSSVLFYVDGQLIGQDADPPYAVDWVDDNPFEARHIMAVVAAAGSEAASDTVDLEPFELTEAAQVQSVVLEASVEDAAGAAVVGLPLSAFRLKENAKPQTIDLVRPETEPTTYLFLIDASQSMAARMPLVKETTHHLLSLVRPRDRVVVAPFTRGIATITGPTDDLATATQAVDAIVAGGGTSIVDSLARAAAGFDALPGRRVVVLITDGYDEHSAEGAEVASMALRQSRVTLYSVAIGGVAGVSLRGERALRRLADQTGGRAFTVLRPADVKVVQHRVASQLGERYVIAYTPSDQRHDGSWRALELTTEDATLRVKTRLGYYAPAPPPVRPALEFTVVGPSQEYLDISRDDLEVIEDGVPQTIDAFQEAVSPVSIVLAVDASGSMKSAVEAMKDGARRFVQALRAEDSLALLQFADRPFIVHDLTRNRTVSLTAIDDYVAAGGTSLYDATAMAIERLKSVEGRRALIVLTDGRDENDRGDGPGSRHTLNDVEALARTTDVTIFGIGIGPRVDGTSLRELATATGGSVFLPAHAEDLDGPYRRIVENLRRRYVIAYTSSNASRDGRWRAVEIRSHVPSSSVSSRRGYFAPAQ
ncbi:MAG: VWA domain-containing protein [Vicinamibacterales bacterium]